MVYHYTELLANKSPILIAQNLLNATIGLVGMFFITRFFPESWDILAFGIGFVGVLSLTGDLGYSTAAIRAHADGDDEATINSTYLSIKLVLGLIFTVLTISSLLIWTEVLGNGFEYTSEFVVILELVPYYFIRNLLAFPQAHFTSRIHAARMGVPSILESVIRNGAFISIGVLYYLDYLKIGQNEMVFVLPVVYIFSFSAYFASSMFLGRPWKFKRPSRKLFKALTVIALPLALSMSLSTVNQNIDKVLIQFYWHATATGAFYLNQRIAVILLNLSLAISVFFMPLLTKYMKEGDMEYVNRSINDFERIIILFILPFIIITLVLSPYILNIFNGYYRPYALVLPLLSLSALLTASYQPFQSALVAKGMTSRVGMVTVISVVINIVLDLILIPQNVFGSSAISIGVDGAAVATLMASLYTTLHLRYYVRRITGYRFRAGLLKLLIPSVVVIALLEVLLRFLQPYPFVELVGVSAVALVIFYGITILLKETSVKEIKEFLTNLNPLIFAKHLDDEKKNIQ